MNFQERTERVNMFNDLDGLASSLGETFSDCADYICRRASSGGAELAVFSMRELADKGYIAESIVRPLLERKDWTGFDGDLSNILRSSKVTPAGGDGAEGLADVLLSGGAVVAVMTDRLSVAAVSADSYFGRGVSEPTSDVTVKGGKSGFVEDAEKNVCLLRKAVRSSRLKCVDVMKGSATRTRVSVLYVEGRAKPAAVSEVIRRLEKAEATVITDSGNLEMLMKERRYGMFPSTGSTEKVEKAAALLVAGRVAIICDGSPFVLTAPYVFMEALQSSEDYLRSPYYATFIRLLRFLSLITALYLPALFLAAYDRCPAVMPSGLYATVARLREEIPFSLFSELFVMLAVFEILREVGLRMPRTVGDAVGIVGSIIIGDAATEAGIASTPVILVVALSAVCNFVVPVFMNQTALLRLALLPLAQFFGFAGIAAGSAVLLAALCTRKSYGVWYMSPLIPFSARGMLDFLIVVPQKTLGRREL